MILLAAMTKNRVIGKDGKMPWHIPAELRLFRRKTRGQVVILGRKTFESIGGPLPNRRNIVVSRGLAALKPSGVEVATSLESALALGRESGLTCFLIGGESLYRQGLPLASEIHLSLVPGEYEGDAFFPAFENSGWKLVESRDHGEFVHQIYHREASPGSEN